MIELPSQVSSVAQVIQLAVAPVFLLTGVGALLGVLSGRLARVIDQFHCLEKSLAEELPSIDHPKSLSRSFSLSRRTRLIYWAIVLCKICYLLICFVIIALFVSPELHIDPSRAIGGLFIAAMLALIAGLVCFLHEISLAASVIEDLKRSVLEINTRF